MITRNSASARAMKPRVKWLREEARSGADLEDEGKDAGIKRREVGRCEDDLGTSGAEWTANPKVHARGLGAAFEA